VSITERLTAIMKLMDELRQFLHQLDQLDVDIDDANFYIQETFMQIHLLTEPFFKEWADKEVA
jgi:hypothetical protein